MRAENLKSAKAIQFNEIMEKHIDMANGTPTLRIVDAIVYAVEKWWAERQFPGDPIDCVTGDKGPRYGLAVRTRNGELIILQTHTDERGLPVRRLTPWDGVPGVDRRDMIQLLPSLFRRTLRRASAEARTELMQILEEAIVQYVPKEAKRHE